MDHTARIDAVEREAAALTAALRAGPLDAPVPTCPEWTLAELATHVGGFVGFWTHVLCEGTARAKTPAPPPPAADGLDAWFEELAGHLVEQLRITPAETTVWTWVDDDKTAQFVARRAAHELSIHRLDAELARGAARPIEADLAADGIEEVFVMLRARSRTGQAAGQTLHLHATDGEHEWLLTLEPDEVTVRREHAKGDLALRGAVGDLELVLYQRPPFGPVERFGDESVLDLWYGEFTFR